jgi:hypothetical protein
LDGGGLTTPSPFETRYALLRERGWELPRRIKAKALFGEIIPHPPSSKQKTSASKQKTSRSAKR